jgi:hypothetical protein
MAVVAPAGAALLLADYDAEGSHCALIILDYLLTMLDPASRAPRRGDDHRSQAARPAR